METQYIKTPIKAPDFKRVIAEIRTRTGINAADAEAIEEFLTEHCRMVDGYYEEEYYIELDSVRFRAYNDGYDDGRVDGYADGYEEGYAEGYDVGYEDGYAV